jgi:NADPH:quinone reductase-like Zn-dependent oxidoreductase
MLTAGEIEAMRDEIELTLPDTAIIYTPASTADGQGGYTQAFAASGTVACRMSPRTGQQGSEPGYAERSAAIGEWVATFPASTTLAESQRVAVGGTTYEVTRVRAPRSWQLSCRADLSKIT